MVAESSSITSNLAVSACVQWVAIKNTIVLQKLICTVIKHRLSKKNLIILRACNELLRRLSRAEDTVFCGRVFIYMFQSFPLGDKSSVNLRGEYHTENVTIFDEPILESAHPQDGFREVDSESKNIRIEQPTSGQLADNTGEASKCTATEAEVSTTPINADVQRDQAQNVEDKGNKFYRDFWSLQKSFAMPTRLFEDESFEEFKQGMSSTMQKFQTVNQGLQLRNPSNSVDETKPGAKRKRDGYEGELSDSFNPKYLTSRDLFDLEVGFA